jgi:hypothetical protein
MTPNIIDTHVDFHEVRSEPGKLVFDYKQDIPDDFLSVLNKTKVESTAERAGEFMHVAAIPVVVHEKWLREGFDCTKAPIRETLKKLRNEHLDDFIVTNKRV